MKIDGTTDAQVRRMSDTSFRLMTALFQALDRLFPYIDRRVRRWGLREGQTVVDYGCGPGRYTVRLARLVGSSGRVYAVDIHPLAVGEVRRRAEREGLANVAPVLAKGYDSGLPDHMADVVCAIDMFFGVPQPDVFLAELWRITKVDGLLIIDGGHEPLRTTRHKIEHSGRWRIEQRVGSCLLCRPL